MTVINEPPVCIWCRRGTTPRRLVTGWVNDRLERRYYAHGVCVARHEGKPLPTDPPVNRRRKIPPLAQRLSEWNALAGELDDLLMQARSEPRGLTLLKIACSVWNAVSWRKTDMTWALVDPLWVDEAGDQVRILRWYVEKLRTALERDPSLRRRNGVCNIEAPNLRLPETVEGVCAAYERSIFDEEDDKESDELIPPPENRT